MCRCTLSAWWVKPPDNVVYTIDQGKRLYVERIEIHGNTKTHDEVIRREFDFGEGDAYNRALVDRAERRLKTLGYFKSVKIGTEPGSAPDRVVLDVTVQEQQTGDFSIAGGYSTTDGWLARSPSATAISWAPATSARPR